MYKKHETIIDNHFEQGFVNVILTQLFCFNTQLRHSSYLQREEEGEIGKHQNFHRRKQNLKKKNGNEPNYTKAALI